MTLTQKHAALNCMKISKNKQNLHFQVHVPQFFWKYQHVAKISGYGTQILVCQKYSKK